MIAARAVPVDEVPRQQRPRAASEMEMEGRLERLAHEHAAEVSSLRAQLQKLETESREYGEQLQRFRERGAASASAAKLWADEAVALERARYESGQSMLLPLQMYALLVLGYCKGVASVQQHGRHKRG